MLRYLLFIFILNASFPQATDERLLLIESRNILTYMDTFEKIAKEQEEESPIASNVAISIGRSMSVVMNAYHLIHIYNIIKGEEDRSKVLDYIKERLTFSSRLLKIEVKVTSKYITLSKNNMIADYTVLYIKSLDFVIKLLNDFSS